MNDFSFIIVDSDLVIRIPDPEKDSEEIFDLIENHRDFLGQFLPWVELYKSKEMAVRFAKGCQRKLTEKSGYSYIIQWKNQIVGGIGIPAIDWTHNKAEIGYWLGKNSLGKGIAVRCCAKLVGFSFKELKLNRVEALCAVENISSQAVLAKNNFQKEGLCKQAYRVRDKYLDVILYARLASEL